MCKYANVQMWASSFAHLHICIFAHLHIFFGEITQTLHIELGKIIFRKEKFSLTKDIKTVVRFFLLNSPVRFFPISQLHIMKNTTIEETRYPVPALRVAFRKEEAAEKKTRRAANSKKQAPVNVESKVDLPLFDDYRRKARDHDPL
jgi:hypothetical protein